MSNIDAVGPQEEDAMFAQAGMAAVASPLARWLAERADRLEAMGQVRDWRPLCKAAMADGVRNAKDGEVTPAVISRVWSRLKHRRRKDGVSMRPSPLGSRPPEPVSVARWPAASSPATMAVPASSAGVALVSPPRHVPVERNPEEVEAYIRITGALADIKRNKNRRDRAQGRAEEGRLRAEGEALGMRLPPRIYEPDDS